MSTKPLAVPPPNTIAARMFEDERRGTAKIMRETGLDYEHARYLYRYRGGSSPSRYDELSEQQEAFCQGFEYRRGELAAEKKLLGPTIDESGTVGDVIEWDLLDRERKRRAGNGTGQAPATHIEQPPTLSYVDLARAAIPERQWLVPDRIPMRNVTSLSGEGAIGKSLLLMQLSAAVVLGKDWIGTLPEQGPVLYMSCEEDDDEVCRRMEAVAAHFGSTRQEMVDRGLRVLSFAGRDAVLAAPDHAGVMQATPLCKALRRDALELRPKLIVLDTVADIFAGKEIDRAQSRQFITLLRGLAIDTGAAVVMAAHPSLTGIATDTGLSGSTGWHNSVRARMYFKPAPGDDTALRVLETKKSNYSRVSESIVLRWRDGVYVPEPGMGTLQRLAIEADVDHLFMKLLRRSTEQGRNVSDNKGPTYAPAKFADTPEAKAAKITSRMLVDAMERLFAADKIKALPEGSPSRKRSRLIEKDAEQ